MHPSLVLAAVGGAVALRRRPAALAHRGLRPVPDQPQADCRRGRGHDGPLTQPVHDAHDALDPVLGPIFGDPNQPGETVHTTVEPLTCT